MVKRIKESKNKYLNDEEIIAKKEKSIRTMVEKRSRNKGLRDRLKKYQMGEWELNALVYYMNKQIVNEMLLAKTWYIPFRMGHIKPTYINFGKHSLVVNWPKSIENHLNIIKKEAPLLYHAYKVEKRITKKEYFKLARPYVSPRKPHNLWLEYFEGQSWAYFRWYSNYKFINKYENYYRLYFTAYNRVPEVAKEVVVMENGKEKTIRFRPQKRKVKIPLNSKNYEVEVSSDESGVLITKIGEKEVNKKVSDKLVEKLTVKDGILSFWEINEEEKSLKYRSINIKAFVERFK
jgi:hypothetical protein